MLLNNPYLENQQEDKAAHPRSFIAWDEEGSLAAFHSSWQQVGCSYMSHCGECTLAQLHGIYASIGSCTALSATIGCALAEGQVL